MEPPTQSSKPIATLAPTVVDNALFGTTRIPIVRVSDGALNNNSFHHFNRSLPLGLSPGYSLTGQLIALAICDQYNCTMVDLQPIRNESDLTYLQELLCQDTTELFAFDMGPLCLSLYHDVGLRVTNAVDIQSALQVFAGDRKPLTAIKEILGSNTVSVMEQNIANLFKKLDYGPTDRKDWVMLAQRAWISQVLAWYENGAETLAGVTRIDTLKLSTQDLMMIAKLANDTLRQDLKRPGSTRHQTNTTLNGSDPATIHSEIYKNKLRSDQSVKMVVSNSNGSKYTIPGHVASMMGRSGALVTERPLDKNITITSVTSIGRDGPTTAEAQRAATILRALQGYDVLKKSIWVKNIWLSEESVDEPLQWPLSWSEAPPPHLIAPDDPSGVLQRLNDSQQDAVNTMLSSLDSHRLTIIQGPPGTGKTSVIAAFVLIAIASQFDGIWLVAQSNVAVKNIAEKLIAVGFEEWRLLVSRDFIFEWHEHIYEKVKHNVIRSDQFMKLNPRIIKGCKVFLCTLSMLSNRHITRFTMHNPIKTLLVDEASQIEIGDYAAVLPACEHLRKMCFIGDDKQLPPFGQEELKNLQSIFEVSHLRSRTSLFLDTQYRMPPQIGDVISELVYEEKLKSNPKHPITHATLACRFIDVSGQEELNGNSYMNKAECDTVIKLASQLQEKQKAYQIITPYDGQRSLIEAEMIQSPGLDWKNKCFNVDSFQGNEEDYIIISLVRSQELGFLVNLRRTNVMLTRCKKGMFIVCNRTFLNRRGASTLVGGLAQKMGEEAWLKLKDLEEGNF